MKQFIVIKDILNIRNRPSAEGDDNFIGSLIKNETVFLNEEEIIGTVPVGGKSNMWLGDNFNRFVASEGVRLKTWEDTKAELINDLTTFWEKKTRGANVSVALVDTGVVSGHPNLSVNLNHINIANDGDPDDPHGTRMAGLMFGKKDNKVVGLAPGIGIAEYKIFQRNGRNTKENLIEALRQIDQNPDIKLINLSLEFLKNALSPNEKTVTDDLIRSCIEKGKIVIAATGNNNEYVMYPGSNSDVITVGAIKNNTAINFPNGIEAANVSKDPDCFIEFGNWTFCDAKSVEDDERFNSSEATAIMSSLIALKIAANPNLIQSEIKKHIKDSSTLFQTKPGLNVFKLNVRVFLNL